MRSTRIVLAAAAATAVAGVLAAAAIPATPAVAASQPLIASLNTAADPQYPQDQQRFSDTGLVQTDGSGGAYFFASGWTLDLRPAAGGTIRPGLYTGVSAATQTSAHAYADLAVGLFDEGFSGDVDVLDWAAGANGVPTRFDIVFTTGPYASSAQGFFGEVRLGEDASTSPDLAATHLEWAPTPVGGTRIVATEWVHNRSSASVAVGAAQVSGDAKADYAVGSNGCSGRTIAAGAKCSFTVGFSPTAAGPRIAALTVPVGGASRTVSLAGSAPLGTSSFTTSGNDAIDGGATHTWTEGGSTQFTQGTFGDGFVFGFTAPYALYDASKSFEYWVGGPEGAAPTVGTHSTTWLDSATDSADVAESGSQFGGPTGTETVKRFDVDAQGRVLDADIDFTLVDVPGTIMTGHLRYRARTDYTPPATPTISGTAAGTSVRWTVPSDAVRSIVRVGMGSVAPADPTAGLPVAAGTATSATLTGLTAHQQYTVAVFAVDAAGNVSAPATTTVTG